MTTENKDLANEGILQIIKGIFDGRRALQRAKNFSDFIGIVTRMAIIKTLDDYVIIRPSEGDGFSQIVHYGHWVLKFVLLIMMFNVFIAIFGYFRTFPFGDKVAGNVHSFIVTFGASLIVFLPVVLFVNESSRIANELVSVSTKSNQIMTPFPQKNAK